MNRSQLGNTSTDSELLFEQYLSSHDYREWTHEERIEGRSTTPDYRLRYEGTDHFFDVKEFDGPAPLTEAGWFDMYGPLRKKIDSARKQFKYYRDRTCSLVLANPKGAFVLHDKPSAVFGAMFGNHGIQVPVGPGVAADAKEQMVFLDGGKMRTRKSRGPQNTTISAIISLMHYQIYTNQHLIRLHRKATELGRKLSGTELMDLIDSVPPVEPTTALRVIIFENPDARIPLPSELFRGPFDERWGREFSAKLRSGWRR